MHDYDARTYDDDDIYIELREALAPEYAEWSDDEIEDLFDSLGMSAEELEGFLRGLKKFAKKAAPIVSRALPGAIKGAMGGAALGPVGMIGGALAGGTVGALSGGGGGGRSRRPSRRRGRGRGRGRGRRGRGGARRAGSPAAASLMQLLSRPEISKALMSMVMGGAGRSQVPVGGSPVPVGAIANLIGTLANQAAAEYHQFGFDGDTSVPSYLLDEQGEYLVDPADPVQRAEALLYLFADAASDDEYEVEDAGYAEYDDAEDEDDFDDDVEDEEAFLDWQYDQLELAELFAGEGDDWP